MVKISLLFPAALCHSRSTIKCPGMPRRKGGGNTQWGERSLFGPTPLEQSRDEVRKERIFGYFYLLLFLLRSSVLFTQSEAYIIRHLSIIPAISVCVSVCVSVTAVSRQPLVRSNWNLPGILLGAWVCAFSRFDINRPSASQVMAIYLPTNDKTGCCVGVVDGEENLSRVPHYGLQRTDFRKLMTSCILIISRFLMRIYR